MSIGTPTGHAGNIYDYERATGRRLAGTDQGTIDYMIASSAGWPDHYSQYVGVDGYTVWAHDGHEIPEPTFDQDRQKTSNHPNRNGRFELTFWGDVGRYRRWHASYEAAETAAHQMLSALDNRAAHPAIIHGPGCGRGVTIA